MVGREEGGVNIRRGGDKGRQGVGRSSRKEEEQKEKKKNCETGELPPGWRWIELEDPWTHEIVCMKHPLEETERQKSKPPPKPSYLGKRERKELRRE